MLFVRGSGEDGARREIVDTDDFRIESIGPILRVLSVDGGEGDGRRGAKKKDARE